MTAAQRHRWADSIGCANDQITLPAEPDSAAAHALHRISTDTLRLIWRSSPEATVQTSALEMPERAIFSPFSNLNVGLCGVRGVLTDLASSQSSQQTEQKSVRAMTWLATSA